LRGGRSREINTMSRVAAGLNPAAQAVSALMGLAKAADDKERR